MPENTNPYAAPSSEVSSTLTANGDWVKAGRGQRLLAVLVDTGAALICYAPMLITIGLSRFGSQESNVLLGIGGALTGLLVLGLLIWNLMMLHRTGQTIGKRVMGVRIVRADGSRAGLGRIFLLRMLVPGLASAIPYIGAIFALANPLWIFGDQRRCLHDLIADTIVVNA